MTSEFTTTPFSNRVAILADLWMNYRDDPQFIDFYEYNDIGLPLSYMLESKIVESTDMAEAFVNETFDLLLAGLETEDEGFESLDELLGGLE
jgi:hypothetical protein